MNNPRKVAASVVLVACSIARADPITYISQDRSVTGEVTVTGGGVPVTFSATDFNEFNQTVQTTAPPYGGSAPMYQDSVLGPSSITDSGSFNGLPPTATGQGRSFGTSYFSVTFSSSYPVSMTLLNSGLVQLPFAGTSFQSGETYSPDNSAPLCNISITGPSGFTTPAANTLEPAGTYTMTVNAGAYLAPGAAAQSKWPHYDATYPLNSFTVTLDVSTVTPEPAAVALLGWLALTGLLRRRTSSINRRFRHAVSKPRRHP